LFETPAPAKALLRISPLWSSCLFTKFFGCAAFNASALPPRRRPQQQRGQRRRQRQTPCRCGFVSVSLSHSLSLCVRLSRSLLVTLLRLASFPRSSLLSFVPSLRLDFWFIVVVSSLFALYA